MRAKWAISVGMLAFALAAQSQVPQAAKAEQVSRPMEAPSATLPAEIQDHGWRPRIVLPSSRLITSAVGDVQAPRIVLPPLNASELQSIQAAKGGEMRTVVGLTRPVALKEKGKIVPYTDESFLSVLEVTSGGAKAVSLHLTGFNLPAGAKLFVAGMTGTDQVFIFEGKGPDNSGEFWSPTFSGDTLRLEVVASREVDVVFGADRVGHLFASPLEPQVVQGCHLDASCYPEWSDSGESVAKIVFSDSQFYYACSAVLLNNNSGDFSPLLLTANHCIETNEMAKTVTAYWFYRSTACNSGALFTNYSWSYSANLLATSTTADASLLEMLQTPPTEIRYSGWNAEPPSVGSDITSIHHPGGTYRRITFGRLLDDLTIKPEFHHVLFTNGMGEQGSSGGPLLNSVHQVLGQLWGGNASCTNPSGDVFYGKLSVAYPSFLRPDGKNYLQEGLPDDRFSPNHTRETAALLADGNNDNLVERLNYPDWFEIKPPEGRIVNVQDSTGGLGALRLELYKNQEETPIAVGVAYDPFLTFGVQALGTDRYFLKVSRQPNSTMRVKYQINVSSYVPPTPSVYSYVSNILRFSATLGAFVYANQLPFATEAWVEWGANSDPSAFTKAGATIIPAGQYNANISVPLSGLMAGTTYYFRDVARNVAGTATTEIRSFTTPATVMTIAQDNSPVGDVPINTYVERSLVVMNSGELPLTIGVNADYLGINLLSNTCSGPIAPGNSCFITVRLGTTSWYTGAFPGQFQIISNTEDSPKTVAFPFVSVGPRPGIDFTSFNPFGAHLLNTTVKRTFVIRNWGNRDLQVSGFSSDSLSFQAAGCSSPVPPGESCQAEASFFASSLGGQTAKIYVHYNSNGGEPYWFGVSASVYDIQLLLTRPVRPPRAESGSTQSFAVMVMPTNAAGYAQLQCEGLMQEIPCTISPPRIPLDRPSSVKVTVDMMPRSQRLRASPSRQSAVRVILRNEGFVKSLVIPVIIAR